MPYITKAERELLREGAIPFNSGQLNYVLAKECDAYLLDKGLSYDSVSEVIKTLMALALHINNRILEPYESQKRLINGEVFECLKEL